MIATCSYPKLHQLFQSKCFSINLEGAGLPDAISPCFVRLHFETQAELDSVVHGVNEIAK